MFKENPHPLTQEQLEQIGRETSHAVHKALGRYMRRTLTAWALVGAAAGYVALDYANALHDGLVGSCERVNLLRAQSNVSDMTSFNVLTASIKESQKIVAANNVPRPIKSARGESIRLYTIEASRLTITGMTDCEKAVNDPGDYKQPIAAPIGNPATGKYNPSVDGILWDSLRVIQENL